MQSKPWFDYICGNHSRNLPFDEFSRAIEAYFSRKLGGDTARVQLKCGGRLGSNQMALFYCDLCAGSHTTKAIAVSKRGWACVPRLSSTGVTRCEKPMCRSGGTFQTTGLDMRGIMEIL